jgi:peptide/nickel transport system substrate-binding protein
VGEANPDYWGPKPNIRRWVYRPIPEAAGRVVALKSGEADIVLNLPAADVDSLKQDPNVVVTVAPGLTIIEAEPRQSKPPFNDVKVRYALNQSIDKDAIIANILRGAGLPLRTPSIPGLFGTFDFDPLPYDPAKAKQLLTEAGYANGFEATIRYVSGRWSGDDQVAEAMQGFWNNVGIKTQIVKIQSAELVPQLSADPDTMAGTVFLLQKTSEYVDYHLYRMYHSDATGASAAKTVTAQRYAYSNPEVDKLIEQEQRTFDPNQRLPILKQAEELIWKDQPLVYLAHQSNVWGNRKNVSGFRYMPAGSVFPGTATKA